MTRLPAEQRREQLLDTAAELFSAQGYARATTAQLARAAGITEPIIYRHFRSKRALFIALIERTGRQTLEQWEEHLAGADDPAERLTRLLGDNPMVTQRGRDAYRVFLQAISESDDEEIHAALHEHIMSLHRFIAIELDRAQQAGRVRDVFSAEVLAWVLIHMGLGYGVVSALGIEGHGRDARGTHVKQVLSAVMLGRRGQTAEDAPTDSAP